MMLPLTVISRMRTTSSIDDDVLQKAKATAAKRRPPFRTAIERSGLARGLKSIAVPPEAMLYQTKPHKLGLKAGKNLDNIQVLLAQIEGEDSR